MNKQNSYYVALYENALLDVVEKSLSCDILENLDQVMTDLEQTHPETDVSYMIAFKLETQKKKAREEFLECFKKTNREFGIEEYLSRSSIINQKKKLYLEYEEMKKKLPRAQEKKIKFLQKTVKDIQNLKDLSKCLSKL